MNRTHIDPCLEGSATVYGVHYDGTNPDPPYTTVLVVPVSVLLPSFTSGTWLAVAFEIATLASNGAADYGFAGNAWISGGSPPVVRAGGSSGGDLQYTFHVSGSYDRATHTVYRLVVNGSGDLEIQARCFSVDAAEIDMPVQVFAKVTSLTYFA